MRFDGSTAFLLGGSLNTAHVTWSAWIKPRVTPSGTGGICGMTDAGGANDKTLHIVSGGTLYFNAYDGSDHNCSSTGICPPNVWTHAVATADGTNLRLFRNGVQEGSVACGNTYTSYSGANIRVGGALRSGGASGFFYFDGEIERLALWTEALTPAQVAMLYAGAPEPLLQPGALFGLWPMLNGSGTVPNYWPAFNTSGISSFSGTKNLDVNTGPTWFGSGDDQVVWKDPNYASIRPSQLTTPSFKGGFAQTSWVAN